MFYPTYLLSSDAEGRWRVSQAPRRGWRPTVVIPRELCLFEAVSCKGVQWHELDGFARLQAARLAPFVDCGANAVVRGQTLMLWFWDEHEVEASFQAGGGSGRQLRKLAETLLLDIPKHSGEVRVTCLRGVDHLTLQNGAIVSSRWVPDARAPQAAAVALRTSPWARERLGMRAQDRSSEAAGLTPANLLRAASLASVVGMGAYAAYWGGQHHGMQQRLAALAGAAQASTSGVGELTRLRQAAAADQAWTDQYRALGASIDLNGLLAALARPMETHAVVLKELEVKNAEVRLSLVSAGSALDVPKLLQALEAMDGVADVQVRQSPDPTQATYTLRADGFRTVPAAERRALLARSN